MLDQGVSLEEVQHPAGHADPRTPRLYHRRQRRSRGILSEDFNTDKAAMDELYHLKVTELSTSTFSPT